MKSRQSLMRSVLASTLLFAGTLAAQETPVPAPPPPPTPAAPTAPMPPAPPMPPPDPAMGTASSGTNSAVYQTPQGELTVNSVPAPAPMAGPAPTFEQLSAGGKAIREEQAAAYAPLANDFIHADANRNGSISATEYQRWSRQP